jgi:hypothetical protein
VGKIVHGIKLMLTALYGRLYENVSFIASFPTLIQTGDFETNLVTTPMLMQMKDRMEQYRKTVETENLRAT